MDVVNRFEVYLVNLDPTQGTEIKKTHPCMIISPDEMNKHLNTVLIAPMTSTVRHYPTRIVTSFQGKEGEIVLDQIRAVDKQRLVKRLGKISPKTAEKSLAILQEMFS